MKVKVGLPVELRPRWINLQPDATVSGWTYDAKVSDLGVTKEIVRAILSDGGGNFLCISKSAIEGYDDADLQALSWEAYFDLKIALGEVLELRESEWK